MAGIQVDLKIFSRLGVHGLSVVSAVIAQNHRQVHSILEVERKHFKRQLEVLLDEYRPAAVKIGVLYTAENMREAAAALKGLKGVPVVVDPVLRASAGIELIKRGGREILVKEVLPLARLITPNVMEGETLAGRGIETYEDMKAACRALRETFGCAVLLKGGHMKGKATDLLFDGERFRPFSGERVRGIDLHGSGCILSSAVTAYLARGEDLPSAVRKAKLFFRKILQRPVSVGKIRRPGIVVPRD
jgi:hydroxymethylpyrimidine/phosphomethylpyrimidine kinase